MKKLLALGLAVMAMSTSVFAANDVNVVVNSKAIDAKGTIVDGRTLVPVRGVFEEMGYTVAYDAETKTATLQKSSNSIKMTAGENSFYYNGKEITPDVPQQIIDGHFMLPLRAVGESINATIDWNSDTKTASIKKSAGLTVMGNLDLSKK